MRNLICVLIFIITVGALDAAPRKRILDRKSREKLLLMGRKYVDLKDEEFLSGLSDYESPFTFEREPKRQEQKIRIDRTRVYTEPEVLEFASQRINPTGVFKRGDRGVLIFPNGNTFGEGHAFKFRFNNKVYNIVIDKIEQDYYILRLNDSTVTRNINKPTSNSKNIRRTP